jgi:WD40 repeat protein
MHKAQSMRRATAKALLILVALSLGLGSAFQLSRYPSRLRAALSKSGRPLEPFFSPDGRKVVLATKEEERITLTSDLSWPAEIAISKDSRLLAVQDREKGLYLWDALEGKLLAHVHGTALAGGDNQTMAFAPNSKLLAVEEAGERRVQILDTTSGDRIAVFDAPLSAIAFAPDGKAIAHMGWNSATKKPSLQLWNMNSGPHRLEPDPNVSSFVTFSPDGTMVATACDAIQGKNEVTLWDARTLQERAPLDLGD